MKVLWFANTPCGACVKLNYQQNIGGWLQSLEDELVKNQKIELSIAFFWGQNIVPFSLDKTRYYPVFRKKDGTKTGRLFNRVFNRYSDKNDVAALLEVINKVKPDLIHIHGTESNFGLIHGLTNIPIIISIQGILTVYSEMYYAGISSFDARMNEGIIPKLLKKSVAYTRNNLDKSALRERKILSQTEYIIGRTEWDRNITRLLSPNSKYFIGNEILRKSFYHTNWSKSNFNFPIQIVTVMSNGLYKGLEMIIKTCEILKNTGTKFNWLVIGQKKSDSVVKIMMRWLKTDQNNLNLSLVGEKTELEVAAILADCHLYCQVSHIENSPNSICEAMLVGLPIIATSAGGTSTLIEHRKHGLLVQPGDAFSLAASILNMVSDFDTAKNYAIQAQHAAKTRHDKETITKELETTYKLVLKI